MSTRGFVSFVVDGEIKTAYNHHDSYPDGLGVDVLEWARTADLDDATEAARALRVVTDEDEPTDADIERLAPFHNPNVGVRSQRPDWYQLLRRTQGKPGVMLQVGVIEDASGFPADSLFAEWGYVLDFDARTLEAYVGFQRAAHAEGRFAHLPKTTADAEYHPVRLVKTWPLTELPSGADFVATLERAEVAAESGGAA